MSNSKYQLSPEKILIGIQVDLSDLKEQTSGIYLLDSIQAPSSIFVPNEQQNTSVCHQLIDFADEHLLNEHDNYEACFWPNVLPSLDTDDDKLNDKEENTKEEDDEDVFALKGQTFVEDNSFWTEVTTVKNYISNSSLENNNNAFKIVKVESPKKLGISSSGQHSNQQPEKGLSNPIKSILKKISPRSKFIKKAEKKSLEKKVVFNEKVVSTSYDLSDSKEKNLKNDVKGKVSRISIQQESEDKHEFDVRRFAHQIKGQFSATDSHSIEQYEDGTIIWPTTFFGHSLGSLDQVIQSEDYYFTESESDSEPDSEIE